MKSKEQEGPSKEGRNNHNSYSIEVEDLTKHFKGKGGMEDIKAVDGISFHVFICWIWTYNGFKN